MTSLKNLFVTLAAAAFVAAPVLADTASTQTNTEKKTETTTTAPAATTQAPATETVAPKHLKHYKKVTKKHGHGKTEEKTEEKTETK